MWPMAILMHLWHPVIGPYSTIFDKTMHSITQSISAGKYLAINLRIIEKVINILETVLI